MAKARELTRLWTALAAGGGVAALVIVLHQAGLLMPIEFVTRDWRMQATLPKPGGHVAIRMVNYSEESLGSIREHWQKDWRDRDLMAEVIRGLSGKPSAKKPDVGRGADPPSVVLFDFFTLSDPVELPESIVGEIESHPTLYIAAPFSLESRKIEYAPEELLARFSIPVDSDGSVAFPEYKSLLLPVEEISRVAHGIADVHTRPDSDQVERRYPLLGRYRDRYFPSFALAAILEREKTRAVRIRQGVLSVGGFSVPLDREGAIKMRYYRQGETFGGSGVYDVMNGRLIYDKTGKAENYDPSRFENKIVIVSPTAAGLQDIHSTPVGKMPGPEIHATAIANLLNADYLRTVGRRWSLVSIVLLALVTSLVTRHVSALAGPPAALMLGGVYAWAATRLFHAGWVIDLAPQVVAILLAYAAAGALNFLYEGLQKKRVKRTFQQYVSAKVVDKILQKPDALNMEGERKILTIFFMDFAGFTTLSETLDPVELVNLLNQYHTMAVEEIFRTEGTLDKFIGDAIMAFWGDPIDQPDHPIRACKAAVAVQIRLKELAKELQGRGLPGIRARIGMNSGPVVAGNMGSREQYNYTVIGSDVNLASRLEGVNKEFGTEIIISDSTYQPAKEVVEARLLGSIQVKGQTKGVRIYELMGVKGQVDPARLAAARSFEQALHLYWSGDWAGAKAGFAKIDNLAAKIYAELCDRYEKEPPPPDWDGTYVMTHK